MINKQAIEIKSVFNLVYYANDVLQNFEVDIASVMTKGHVDNSKVLWLALNNHEPGTAVKILKIK